MTSKSGIALLLLVLISPGVVAENTVDGLAQTAVDMLKISSIQNLAELFHYPEALTAQERLADEELLKRSLDILLSEFGDVLSFERTEGRHAVYEVGVFGGTIDYWRDKERIGEIREQLFRVKFGRAGDGFVKVALYKSGEWKIRSLALGIGIDKQGGRDRIKRATDRLHDLIIGARGRTPEEDHASRTRSTVTPVCTLRHFVDKLLNETVFAAY